MAIDRIRYLKPTVIHWATPLAGKLIQEAAALRLNAQTILGATVVSGGVDLPGSILAGKQIAEIALGGLGDVSVGGGSSSPWMDSVSVRTADPVLACLGSQHPGWAFHSGDFQANIAGPARALARQESLFDEIGHREEPTDRAVAVLFHHDLPPTAVIEDISRACGIPPHGLTLIVIAINSLPGMVVEAARLLEMTLMKARGLGFPLANIVDGSASVPLPPPAPTAEASRQLIHTTMAQLGTAHLIVRGSDAAAKQLAEALPFADGGPTAPAKVVVSTLDTGHSFSAQRLGMV